MLGGLLIGGLLGSLFMGHGFASGIMSWLMLGIALILLLISLYKLIKIYNLSNKIIR